MTFAILHEQAYDGPSLWLDRPVVRIILRSAPGVSSAEPLHASIEELGSKLSRERFDPLPLPKTPDRLEPPWWLGWGAIGLQRLAGDDVAFFSVRPLEQSDLSDVVVECRHRKTGLLAVRLALQQMLSLTTNARSRFDLETAFTRQLALVASSRRPDSASGCILAAARARGIPIVSIDPRGRVNELGTGVYRRRLFNTTTSNTSSIGEWISGDKYLSLHYLRECGLPAPETSMARNSERTVELAREIGFPVVVKPIDEGDAAGVHVDLRSDDEVRAAFDDAAATSGSGTVVVQRYLIGKEYRFLVVGGQIVALIHRAPAHVVGDGMHSIRELVEIENRDPRRGKKKSDRLKKIEIDRKLLWMLERQGLGLEDVPIVGAQVPLKPTGHITAGGEAIEMTGAVHPENAEIVVAAARALEVDIAGIDLIAEDIERSIWETSGGIVEVNCGPGFWIHQFPSAGVDIDPGPAVIETLFPMGAPVRVPLVAVTGGHDTGAISRMIGRLLTTAGCTAGIASEDELYLGVTRLGGIDGHGIAGKRRILLNPAVELAVLEITPEEIVEQGLAFDVCDVAVVTSLSSAAPAGLARAESVVCRQVAPDGMLVVPADDREAVEFTRSFNRPIVLYGVARDLAAIQRYREDTDRIVTARSGGEGTVLVEVGLGDGSAEILTLTLDARPSTVAAAVGAVLALGISVVALRQSIPGTRRQTPLP